LQKNKVELESWRWGFNSEFSELYFVIFAATHGSTSQSTYSSLQMVVD